MDEPKFSNHQGTAGETLRAARDRYFADNGFDERSYASAWVRLEAGPVPLFFPNTAARVRAVRFHDLHHALTGYGTSWTGEAEIGAWEIASGCGRHWIAYLLNLQAMAIGLFLSPRRVWEAFQRGRHSGNFYRCEFEGIDLDRPADAYREALGLIRTALPPVRARDVLTFAVACTAGLALLGAALIPLAAVLSGITALGRLVWQASLSG